MALRKLLERLLLIWRKEGGGEGSDERELRQRKGRETTYHSFSILKKLILLFICKLVVIFNMLTIQDTLFRNVMFNVELEPQHSG